MHVYSVNSLAFVGIRYENECSYAPDSEIDADYGTFLEIFIAKSFAQPLPEAQRIEGYECQSIQCQ